MKYAMWLAGIAFFLIFGFVTILKPRLLYDDWLRRAEEAQLPFRQWIQWWTSSWIFRPFMVVGGVACLAAAAILIWGLWRELMYGPS